MTYLAIVLIIDYPRYDAIFSGMTLKNSLVDQMLFFLVFFYGLRSNDDALTVLKVLLMVWVVAHIFAVLDATGMFHIGAIEQRSDGRVQGAIGESNQYGAFCAMSLPAIIAMIPATRGMWRLFWLIASIITAATLLMTVSRGAFVATAFATMCGVWLFRRYMPARKLLLWAACGLVAAVLVGVVVTALGFGDLIYARVVGQASIDIDATSSNRTEIWVTVLEVMFRTPISLITGFGWESYATFPFRWVTHNHYLALFFNLGLVGLICGTLLFVVQIRTANKAATYASPEVRPVLIAFGIGNDRHRHRRVLRQSLLALALVLGLRGHRHAPGCKCARTGRRTPRRRPPLPRRRGAPSACAIRMAGPPHPEWQGRPLVTSLLPRIKNALSKRARRVSKHLYQSIRWRALDRPKILMIVGCQRSGTTLMGRLFDADRDCRVFGEYSALSCVGKDGIRLEPAPGRRGRAEPRAGAAGSHQAAGRDAARAYAAELLSQRESAVHVSALQRRGELGPQKFGPRNAIDNIRPIATGDTHNWRSAGATPAVRERIAQFFSESMNPNDAAALFWFARNQLYYDLELAAHSEVMLCRYEHLVAEPVAVMQRIYDFTGAACPDLSHTRQVHSSSVTQGQESGAAAGSPLALRAVAGAPGCAIRAAVANACGRGSGSASVRAATAVGGAAMSDGAGPFAE